MNTNSTSVSNKAFGVAVGIFKSADNGPWSDYCLGGTAGKSTGDIGVTVTTNIVTYCSGSCGGKVAGWG